MDTLRSPLKPTNIFCQQLEMAIILLQDQKPMNRLIKHVLTYSSRYNGIFEPSYINKSLLPIVNDQAEVTAHAVCCQ